MEWKGDDNAAGAPGGIWYRECRDNQNVWSNWAKIAYLTDCTDTLKKSISSWKYLYVYS